MNPKEVLLDELEVDVGTSMALQKLELETVADLLARSPDVLPPRAANQVQQALADFDITWGDSVEVPLYVPPEDRRRSRWAVTFVEGGDGERCDRVGGSPTVWGEKTPWPTCASCHQPMRFVLQILSKRAGGHVDLGDSDALQVFLCEGERCSNPWEPFSGSNAALLRSNLLDGSASPLSETPPPFRMVLQAQFDDALLENESAQDENEEEYWEAFAHGQADKIGGIPVTGNPPRVPRCPTCGTAMEFFAQIGDERILRSFDDGVVVLHLCPQRHAASYQAVR